MASGGRLTYLLAASDKPLPAASLQSTRFPGRRWVRVDPAQVAGGLGPDDVPVLTDDYAPVDRLIATVAEKAR